MKLQQFWAGYFSGSQKYITLKPKYFLPGCGPLFKLSFFYFSLTLLKLWIRKLEYQKSNFPCFLSHWFDTRPIRILERTYLIYYHSKCAVPERGKLTEHHDESNVQWVARQIVKSGRLILLSACSITKIKAILRSRSSVIL